MVISLQIGIKAYWLGEGIGNVDFDNIAVSTSTKRLGGQKLFELFLGRHAPLTAPKDVCHIVHRIEDSLVVTHECVIKVPYAILRTVGKGIYLLLPYIICASLCVQSHRSYG